MKPYYEDSHVTIYHADCLDVLPTLDAVVDTLITDPPYAAAAATVTTGRARNKWGINWGDASIVKMLVHSVLDAAPLAEDHQVYWFGDHISHSFTLPLFLNRFPMVQTVVWDKERLGMGAYYRKQTELILYARTRGAPEFIFRNERDVVRQPLDLETDERLHPAQKPVALLEKLIGDTESRVVLDPFCGIGSTCVAAARAGRKAVGVEIEEKWCEVAAERCSQGVLDL